MKIYKGRTLGNNHSMYRKYFISIQILQRTMKIRQFSINISAYFVFLHIYIQEYVLHVQFMSPMAIILLLKHSKMKNANDNVGTEITNKCLLMFYEFHIFKMI